MATRQSSVLRQLPSQLQHVVLTPVLPGKREHDLVGIESSLLDRLIEATKHIRDTIDQAETHRFWDKVRYVLTISKSIHSDTAVNKSRLCSEFAELQPGNTIIIHIEQQNAGLLVRRCSE